MNDRITAREFHAAEGVEDWRVVGADAAGNEADIATTKSRD